MRKYKKITDEEFVEQYIIEMSKSFLGIKVTDTEIINKMGISRSNFYRKKKMLANKCRMGEIMGELMNGCEEIEL